MKQVLTHLGYLFIWGDVWILIMGIHALFVSPEITALSYLEIYFSLLFQVLMWVSSWSEFLKWWILLLLGFPASLLFIARFVLSSLVGVWILKFANQMTAKS